MNFVLISSRLSARYAKREPFHKNKESCNSEHFLLQRGLSHESWGTNGDQKCMQTLLATPILRINVHSVFQFLIVGIIYNCSSL
jgi:hypothetical protein